MRTLLQRIRSEATMYWCFQDDGTADINLQDVEDLITVGCTHQQMANAEYDEWSIRIIAPFLKNL